MHLTPEDCLYTIGSSLSMMMHASGASAAPVDWRDSTLTLDTSCYGSDVSQLRTSLAKLSSLVSRADKATTLDGSSRESAARPAWQRTRTADPGTRARKATPPARRTKGHGQQRRIGSSTNSGRRGAGEIPDVTN